MDKNKLQLAVVGGHAIRNLLRMQHANKLADNMNILIEVAELHLKDEVNLEEILPQPLGGHIEEEKRYYAGGYDQALSDIKQSLAGYRVEKR